MFPAERVEDEVRRVLRSESFFDLLGLPQDVSDEDAVRRAYKALSVRIHPDKCSHPDAAEAFKQLRRACDVLLDPDTRAAHRAEVAERQRQAAAAGGASGPPRRMPFMHAPYLAKERPAPPGAGPPQEAAAREAAWEQERRRGEERERLWREAEERRRQRSAQRQALHKSFADPMRLVASALRQREVVEEIRHLDGHPPATPRAAPPPSPAGLSRPTSASGPPPRGPGVTGPGAAGGSHRCPSPVSSSTSSSSEEAGATARHKRSKKHSKKDSGKKEKRKKTKREKSAQQGPPAGRLDQLRQERLQREYAERRRAQALLKAQYD
eukprot:EG_transcript_16700